MTDEYLEMIIRIADAFPKMWFYTYTKQYGIMIDSGYKFADLFRKGRRLSILISTWCGLYKEEQGQIETLKSRGFNTASVCGDEYSNGAVKCRNQTEGIYCNQCGICQTGRKVAFEKH